MDHMMPGMDGVEALRRIRAIDSPYARSVPIVILTANVVAGHEKMFLEQGFQAFLSKPIDPSKLHAVIKKWIKDRRQKIRQDSPRRRKEDVLLPHPSAGLEETTAPAAGSARAVEGLDMQEAVSRFGSEAIFLDVLRSYAANTPELLEQMRRLTKKDMATCVVVAHGIKGSSYGVGAVALGDMAKEMEHAAMSKDWRKVLKGLPSFLEAAEELLRGIAALLHERMPAAVAEENKPLRPAPDAGELAALCKACLDCSHSAMEEHLHNLEQYRYQSGGEHVTWQRARVDAIDSALISERLAEYSSCNDVEG
jgi:HPt (histidine-containing phosphotransfer) domain-containing protein